MSPFKALRILILLAILLGVALSAYRAKNYIQSWSSTVHVAVFPINADASEVSRAHIAGLKEADFAPVQEYFEQQSRSFGMNLIKPVQISLGSEIKLLPPERPTQANLFTAALWSLQMRFWAWRHTPKTDIRPNVRLYLLYFDPARRTRVPDSAGLAKGHLGVANLFASPQLAGSNLVVISHELLHTFGASDKYDPHTTLPLFPIGYAEPTKRPLHPQTHAEIMGARIPISDLEADIPPTLQKTVVGAATALEIGWLKP